MNYYFTADKWYGPYNGESGYKVFLLPSGPSSIPQFAGMVKEYGKDFVFEYTNVFSVFEKPYTIKTAVPVAEEKLSWQEEVIVREEEGKQTFSEEERPEIANAALKRVYADIETSGEFRSTWVDGYCQALRDFNIGT